MCDITLLLEIYIKTTKIAILLAKNNANFVTKIILTRENGGRGVKQKCENGVR